MVPLISFGEPMSIDNAVNQRIKQILDKDKYCNEEKTRLIAQEESKQMQKNIEHDLDELSGKIDSASSRLDRMWDTIQELKSPQISTKKRNFLKWLKFWG